MRQRIRAVGDTRTGTGVGPSFHGLSDLQGDLRPPYYLARILDATLLAMAIVTHLVTRSLASLSHERLLRRSFPAAVLLAAAHVRPDCNAPRAPARTSDFPRVLARTWHAMGGLVEESLHCLESSLADQRFDAIVDVLELVRGHLFPHRADDGYRGAHYLLQQLPHRQSFAGSPILGNSEFDYHDRSKGGGPSSRTKLGTAHNRTVFLARRLGSGLVFLGCRGRARLDAQGDRVERGSSSRSGPRVARPEHTPQPRE